MAKLLTGIVQSVEYTHGGMGNQYTTIDGVRYITFWDIRTRDWKEGDAVQFNAVERSLWEGQAKALHAENIMKVTTPASSASVAKDAGHALEVVYPWGYRSTESMP